MLKVTVSVCLLLFIVRAQNTLPSLCHEELNSLYNLMKGGESADCDADVQRINKELTSCTVQDSFRTLIHMKQLFDEFGERDCFSGTDEGCTDVSLYECLLPLFADSWFDCERHKEATICLEGMIGAGCQLNEAVRMHFSITRAQGVYCVEEPKEPIACVNEWGLWHAVPNSDCRNFTREVHGSGQTFNFQTWPGTKFDTRICGQQHESQVKCAI